VLEHEVVRLQAVAVATAAAASSALLRAAGAADAAVLAEQRALRAQADLSSSREQVAALLADLAALREELVWAFAAGRADVAPAVVDLRDGQTQTA
jgi:hypothetical protein